MPSELLVPITEIKNLRPHPNADRLELADVLGWQIVVGKDLYTEGERIVYVPPDSMMPQSLSDALEITKFLSNGRVRQAKLRGEPSFGATVPLGLAKELGVDVGLPLGTNVANELGITKYEAPLRPNAGDAEAEHPLFVKYTDIDNIRNYPNIFEQKKFMEQTVELV
jgi:RNA ligase (TIGR02306 family)